MATAIKSKSVAQTKTPAVSKMNDSKTTSKGSKTTTNHKTIQSWVEQRGGKPSMVKSTGSKDKGGILRIDFPGYSGEDSLETVSWKKFFEVFDANGLAFLYQERTSSGKESHFNKFVSREGEK